MLVLVPSDDGRSIDLRPGDTVRVNLPENASTGFRWAVDRYDAACIELVGSEASYAAQGRAGAGGEVSFSFRGRQAGSGEIVLKHWRSWEGESSVSARFRVRFQVLP